MTTALVVTLSALAPEAVYVNVIRMGKTRAATSILSVRVSPNERELLDAAATQARTSISDFVRRAAIEAAELDVLNRTTIAIPAEFWEASEAWAALPGEVFRN
jgi:uncharacterized protein (DUF1778 family)